MTLFSQVLAGRPYILYRIHILQALTFEYHKRPIEQSRFFPENNYEQITDEALAWPRFHSYTNTSNECSFLSV